MGKAGDTMMGLRQFIPGLFCGPRVKKPNQNSTEKPVALPLARCARVPRATACLAARSSWSGGLSHPPLTIPPVQGRRPVYPAGRGFVPSPSLLIVGDFALPRTPIAQGPCPRSPQGRCPFWPSPRRRRSAPAPLTNRRAVGCAPRRAAPCHAVPFAEAE